MVLGLIKSIESTGTAPGEMLQGLIRLLPKGGNSHEPSDYRPITLLQLHYKIVTKLFANRWKQIASEYFSDVQIGFVPGRFIGDHIKLVLDTRDR